ncbi:hypothetical protein DFH08DRAFT_978946 [Mycena albidolilacea]|uniref:Uncharacterized protein n=1 Tax=Mycena albidolilacea TaxID=1033008 RepID=A0AAD6YYJ7_9AGAR|nr:hypothetical protein DFH08DRAFT_978946 [Mycena albidolilacea]
MASSDDAPPAAGSIIYKKMTKAQLKANNFVEDPIYAFIIDTLLPMYRDKVSDTSYTAGLSTYAKTDLFDIIAEKMKLTEKGYNLGKFKETLYITLKNNHTQLPKKKNATMPPPTEKPSKGTKPTARSAFDEFRDLHKEAINAAVQKQLDGVERTSNCDGKYLSAFTSTLNERWANASTQEKEEMQAIAERKNGLVEAGPTVDDITRNQETAATDLFQLLKGRIGHDWGQIGDAVFFVRGAYAAKDGSISRFYFSAGRTSDMEPFEQSEDEKLAFAKWATKTLKPPAKSPIFPDVDVLATPPDELREILRGLAGFDQGGMPRPVGLRVEGVFEVELELASDEQVRRYCQHFQQVQKDGGKGKLTKNETKDVAAPLVPPAGDAVQTSTPPPVQTSTPPPVQTSTPPPVPPAGDTVQTITPPPGDTSTPPPVETSTPPPVQTSTPPPVPPAGDAVQTSTPPPVQTSTPPPVPPAGNAVQTSTPPPVQTSTPPPVPPVGNAVQPSTPPPVPPVDGEYGGDGEDQGKGEGAEDAGGEGEGSGKKKKAAKKRTNKGAAKRGAPVNDQDTSEPPAKRRRKEPVPPPPPSPRRLRGTVPTRRTRRS